MLVHKKSRNLILNLRDVDRIKTIIPTAKEIQFKGRRILAIPHKLDEVRVLRNMGIDAPSPIEHYYGWPGRFKPYDHQRHTSSFLTLNPLAFCLNDMGTGKTISVLWAFDYLRSIGAAKRLLVVGPLSTLERTWADEVFKHFPHLSCHTLHGTSERRIKLLKSGADVFVINHDGIKSAPVLNELLAMVKAGEIDVIVPDELASFRNASTERWKALNRLVRGAKYVWGLTGTPIPNEPTDAWAQIRLVNPTRTAKYFTHFRDAVMKQVGPYKWSPRTGALDFVYAQMQPAIRYARADCIDLPPTTYQTRTAQLSPEQAKAYKEMMSRLKVEFNSGQVTAVNEAAKLMKLLQIVCGVAYTDGDDMVLPAQERIDLVSEIIEEARAKVIVFVPLTGALQRLAAELAKKFSVAVVHGGTTKSQRDQIFGDFQQSRNPRVIVANAGAMSHGLTLTAADTIIWFAPINSAETYTQANARIVRPGQKLNTLIVHIEGSPVEQRMYDRLAKRSETQGVLLELFKE